MAHWSWWRRFMSQSAWNCFNPSELKDASLSIGQFTNWRQRCLHADSHQCSRHNFCYKTARTKSYHWTELNATYYSVSQLFNCPMNPTDLTDTCGPVAVTQRGCRVPQCLIWERWRAGCYNNNNYTWFTLNWTDRWPHMCWHYASASLLIHSRFDYTHIML